MTDDLTVIGIGSSAGGLEALQELVGSLPAAVPVSYVIVQHISPNHKSLMTQLVGRHTKLSVQDVKHGAKPQPNVIYVTPPRTDIVMENGVLRLLTPSQEPASPKPSVNRFLSSLASELGERSMGIILSGTGSDGAYGIQAIREAGGITIAQDNETAKYNGMPQAAVQTGCVDLILSPNEIGIHLDKILRKPRDFSEFRSGKLSEHATSELLQVLLARTRVDFREYKQTTINRRIERRMVALQIDTQEEYTQFCRNNPHEIDVLYKDLLISVTRFFRDEDEFERLGKHIPDLIEQKGDAPLRVWVAGCATGEEAYSIAMLMAEALPKDDLPLKQKVQIFATDIDSKAIKIARTGKYSSAALTDIPDHLAKKYLIRHGDEIRVVENVRSAVLFSEHNICNDPPFQKVDLICCRNVLIYFGNSLQQRVMERFHYSLNPHGLMFLGTAESVAGSESMFVPVKAGLHIFGKRRVKSSNLQPYNMPNIPFSSNPKTYAKSARTDAISTEHQLFEALVASLGENSILVSEDYSIARVYGDVTPFIKMSSDSSLKMHIDLLRSPLREEARRLITLALKHNTYRNGVRHLLAETDTEEVRLDVYPMVANEINERAALIVFTPVKVESVVPPKKTKSSKKDDESEDRIRTLENEVATTREALQQMIEELETSNEELQSLNEELQSTNEELQAANEELETSNEELQSTNEELITVNEELQVTASELDGRSGELASVLESAPMAILVLDKALQVTQATLAAAELFQIPARATTPHVSQCVLPEGFPGLAPFCSEALRLGAANSIEFTSDGDQVRMSCAPFFEPSGKIRGVTLLVTKFPGLADRMELLLESSGIFYMNRRRTGEILEISAASAHALGLPRKDAIGKSIYDLVSEDFGKSVNEEDIRVLDGKETRTDRLTEVVDLQGRSKAWMYNERHRYRLPDSTEDTIFAVGVDVTELVRLRQEAEAHVAQLELLQDDAGVGYWALDVASNTVQWSKEVYRIHGLTPEEYDPTVGAALSFYHPDDVDEVTQIVSDAIENGSNFEFIKRVVTKQGKTVQVSSHATCVTDETGKVTRVVGIFREVDFE